MTHSSENQTESPAITLEDALLADFAEQKDPAIVWWAALVGPSVATGVALLLIYLTVGWAKAIAFFVAALTAFFVMGRFIILMGDGTPSEEPAGFFLIRWFESYCLEQLDASQLFLMLTWLDMMVAIFVAFHMAILFRVPLLGQKLRDLVSDGRFVLAKQPWIRRAAFSGLIFFVIFPTSTTGSIGGTIFGRLLGMTRARVLIAIFMGSVLGNGVMLIGARFFNEYLSGDNIWLKLGGVMAIVFALFFFERKIRGLKRKYLAEEEEGRKEKERVLKAKQGEAEQSEDNTSEGDEPVE